MRKSSKPSKASRKVRSASPATDYIEPSLIEANRRLKSIQVANEVATWTWDIRNDRVVADQNMAKLFGLSFEDASGGPIEKYILAVHPDDREIVKAAIAKVLEGPVDRYETNYRILRKDGGVSWVLARGAVERDSDGKPRYFPGVVIDVSALRASEQKADELNFRLEQQSRILDITLSSISDFAYIFDRDGRFAFVNQALLNLWGLKLEDAVGKNFLDLKYPDELAARLQQQIQKVFETKVGLTDQTEYTSPTGAGGHYEYIFRPVFNRDGNVELVAGSTRDITEHKRVEAELRESQLRFRDLAESLDTQVQSRTTELNQANESLRNLSARLLHLRDEEARRLARELHDSVGQMLSAIGMNIATVKSQVLNLDETATRAMEENAGLIDQISAEIRTISYLLHPPLLDELGLRSALGWYVDGFSERSKIKVELEIPNDFGRLASELEIPIFRVVQECLTNIHRHSGSKSALIKLSRENDQIIIVAQDWGQGIAADKLRRVKSEGLSGVGFRGMRERLRYLGGNLELHSDSKGTVVTARLPAGKAVDIVGFK